MSSEIKICQGDIRTWLPKMNSNSVDCVVTSPPYWGLRDYNVQNQIGLEPAYQQYVTELTTIFRELRRVLKPTGTFWLNLGDSYANGFRGGYKRDRVGVSKNKGATASDFAAAPNRQPQAGLKDKDLCGIPWRVALALQADGWYLRQDIIWHKPNPMPESVTDRCTKAHEYLFLLTKSKDYYFDHEVIKEPTVSLDPNHPSYRPNSVVIAKEGRKEYSNKHKMSARNYNPAGRNCRSVWTITTTPFREAHFATFPPKLVEPCILAGCPINGIVLDPFAGAGTVGLVAKALSRHAILVELNPDYCKMIEKRLGCSPSS